MEAKTTLQYLNGSWYVRIPRDMTWYFGITSKEQNQKKCLIEDLSKKQAKITFTLEQ